MRRVLVVGGSGGLGRATVEYFSKRGYKVDFTYHRSEKVASELERIDGVRGMHCDLRNRNEIRQVSETVAKAQDSKLQSLIFCAGVENYDLYDLVNEEVWAEVMAVNLSAALYFSQDLRSAILSSRENSIVFCSSIWGQTGAAMEAIYSASKAGLIGLGKSLAKELGSAGVRVNIISPGAMETPMLARFTEAELAKLKAEIPLERLGEPLDFAKLAYFLVAEDRYMTGQVLGLNGGLYI
ncbi:MAG: SDR family oxidoreductase [Eubacteriales bacterium]|nr:SDR family oxidoreductase [Eubacteriales bacterium]